MTETSWAGEVDQWVRSQPWFVLALLVSLFLSTALSLVKYSAEFVGWVQDRRVEWQDAEYAKLDGLGAGINAAIFDQTLGAPTFIRQADDGRVEKSYQGRGFWVQTIENGAGGVDLMAVTSCLPNFNPQFTTPVGATVVLNKTKFFEFRPTQGSSVSEYFLSGATANSRFYDIYSLGNPSNYQTVWLGINDACDWDRDAIPGFPFDYQGLTKDGGAPVEAFRRAARVNTYAVSAPMGNPTFKPFQVGVDRILTRTLAIQPTLTDRPR